MKPVPRILAATAILFNLLCFSPSGAEAQRRRPNILVIVTDDMGLWGTDTETHHSTEALRSPARIFPQTEKDLRKIVRKTLFKARHICCSCCSRASQAV
jgi:hypothetical protein